MPVYTIDPVDSIPNIIKIATVWRNYSNQERHRSTHHLLLGDSEGPESDRVSKWLSFWNLKVGLIIDSKKIDLEAKQAVPLSCPNIIPRVRWDSFLLEEMHCHYINPDFRMFKINFTERSDYAKFGQPI